ncbi:MAG: zinc dependent phospholipase C family protein [Firmicutes bacterium]|uniref:Zinc dependent phospholipase C family protein n=1 Tax=Candidatus Onthovivens merdipullorum TaxID=2840889 RepID=A0A9D9DJ23_9BACL|nr:zinc dependent phospholipase C family protein [Candidatus Onthovivens merdipullorum]
MPSILTHYAFIKNIEKDTNNIIYLGTQGPDPYFFFPYGLIKRKNTKEITNIGTLLHDYDPSRVFTYLYEYIKNHNFDTTLMSYFKGYIAHYALDSTCHPYIFYKSGFVTPNDNNHKFYFFTHAYIESSIDRLIVNHFNIKISPSNSIKNKKEDILKVSKMMACLLKDVFKINYIDNKTFYIAYKRMRLTYRVLYSKFSYKKSLLEKFLPLSAPLAVATPTTKKLLDIDYLNTKHSYYLDPTNNLKKQNYNFYQLMDIAKTKYFNILNIVNNSTSTSLYENLNKFIKKIDYDGKEIGKKQLYFDLIFRNLKK